MKPDPAAPADPLLLLRQQLILAQVRIMELEDERDELGPKLSELTRLRDAAQVLADAKLEEAAHLAKVLTDLQAQFEHLRHMQHVTNEALNATRNEFNDAAARLAVAEARNQQFGTEVHALTTQTDELRQSLARSEAQGLAANSQASARLEQVNALEAELRAMKASRSWRWTRWLRASERSPRDDSAR